ncbi:MAG: ADP-forming succinate--CoA ligase subunit beta [Legionellales bacterium]|nr:ADP-forming succinate--CoA ligase subunit beta [Legionellales bacterium]
MNLHEYQAKKIFFEYGLPIPSGTVVAGLDEAMELIKSTKSFKYVVKAQVHAGGRGKAGGVKLVSTKEELIDGIKSLLGKYLVTIQTDSKGQPVNTILVEEQSKIKNEMYLSAVIDRSSRRIVIMASTEGGVDIEEVAKNTPNKIFKTYIDPLVGPMPYQIRELGFNLNLNNEQIKQLRKIIFGLIKMFHEKDLSLVEINPLAIDEDNNLLCLDSKMNVDENALYRQPEMKQLRDRSQEDERVNHANDWELNYIPLDGNIGCMVNGAGLAMATMDIIKLYGGEPANFLDVGGSATKERVTEALKIILSDSKVSGILGNIFGGIVRCDLIADGIIEAVKEISMSVPLVVRLEGNNAELAAQKFSSANLNIISAKKLQQAAKTIVDKVGV